MNGHTSFLVNTRKLVLKLTIETKKLENQNEKSKILCLCCLKNSLQTITKAKILRFKMNLKISIISTVDLSFYVCYRDLP